jgi:hypothetical protein
MPMDAMTRQILEQARALLTDPDRWTQRSAARTATGMVCDTKSRQAVCWCAVGAIDRYAPTLGVWSAGLREMRALILARGEEQDLADFNDSHTHAEVLALFAQALAS